jgi:hypothetical protein
MPFTPLLPGSGTALGGESELWFPPTVAHANDQEFNGGGLPSPWTTDFTISGSSIDLAASFASGNPRLDVGVKRSWVRLQAPGDSTRYYVYRDFGGGELPNGTYWARLFAPYRFGAPTQADSEISLTFAADSGGSPDMNELIRLYHAEKDASMVQPSFDRTVGGADAVTAQLSDGEGFGQHMEYVAVVKTGSVFDGYVASRGGNWVRLGTFTHPSTLVYVGFMFENIVTSTPGNAIVGFDFFRYRSDGQLP